MTQVVAPRMRQVVDWSAAIWAGLIAGLIFLLLNLFYAAPALALDTTIGASAASFLRLQAAPILGNGAASMGFLVVLVTGLAVHFTLAILSALLLAFLIHRWGLLIGIIGGALFGLAFYSINFTIGSYFATWLFALRGTPMVISHMIFGALAGGIYEALEVEEFEPVEA